MYLTKALNPSKYPDIRIPVKIDVNRLILDSVDTYGRNTSFYFYMKGNVPRKEILKVMFPHGIGGEAYDFQTKVVVYIGTTVKIVYDLNFSVKYKMIVDGSETTRIDHKYFYRFVQGDQKEFENFGNAIMDKFGHKASDVSKSNFYHAYNNCDIGGVIRKLNNTQIKEANKLLIDHFFPS